MDVFSIFLLLSNFASVTINQSPGQYDKSSSDMDSDQKPDRVFRPLNPDRGLRQQTIGQPNYDPIEASYQRLPFPGDPNAVGMPVGVQVPPTGNFPGDQPPPGIPIQPNQNIDRHFPGVIGDNCLFKLKYYMASCEDALLQRQRDSRNARTAPDIQRRMCCSLYFYYDCLSKLVIQYCRDASPMVVNLVMPENRRREMAINCRTQTRDQCNSANTINIGATFFLITILSFIFGQIRT